MKTIIKNRANCTSRPLRHHGEGEAGTGHGEAQLWPPRLCPLRGSCDAAAWRAAPGEPTWRCLLLPPSASGIGAGPRTCPACPESGLQPWHRTGSVLGHQASPCTWRHRTETKQQLLTTTPLEGTGRAAGHMPRATAGPAPATRPHRRPAHSECRGGRTFCLSRATRKFRRRALSPSLLSAKPVDAPWASAAPPAERVVVRLRPLHWGGL